MTACRDCGREWAGLSESHCVICHEQFAADSTSEKHWCDGLGKRRHKSWCDGSEESHTDSRGDWKSNHCHPSEIPGIAKSPDGRWRTAVPDARWLD